MVIIDKLYRTKYRQQCIITGILAISCSIVLYCIGTQMRHPDDYLISGIYSGVYGDGLNSLLIPYINIIHGLIVRTLFAIYNTPSIWGIYMLFLLAYASTCQQLLLIAVEASPICNLFVLILQYVVGRLFLTYTIIAYILSGSSILLYLYTKREQKYVSILSIIGIFAGLLLRPQTAITTIVLLAPSFAKKRHTINLRKMICLTFIIMLILVVDKTIYNTNDIWNNYYKWNQECTLIRDYQIRWDVPTSFNEKRLVLSNNDISMIENWNYADNNIFSFENLHNLNESVSVSARYNLKLLELIKKISGDRYFIGALLISISLMMYSKSKIMRVDYYQLSSFALFLILLIGLYARKRYVERIYLPLFILWVIQSLCIVNESLLPHNGNPVNHNINTLKMISICVLVASIFAYTISPVYRIRREEIEENIVNRSFLDLCLNHQDSIFICNPGLANSINVNKPIKELSVEDYPNNVIKTGSWDTFSGRYYYLCRKLQDPDALFINLIYSDEVYLATYSNEELNRIRDFLSSHYEINSEFVLLEEWSSSEYYIYKLCLDEGK